MWVWVDRIGIILLDAGISAVILWALAALALLGSRQPARRLLIARAAMVGSLAFLPLNGLDLVPQYDIFAFFERLGVFPHPLAGTAGVEPGASSRPAWFPVMTWPVRLLTVSYLAAIVGGLGWLALGYAAVARFVGRSWEPSPETLALLDSLPYQRRGPRPRLRVCPGVRRPVLVGPFRPVILIPAVLDRPEARDRLRLSLMHEFAHAESRDPGFTLLANLARAVWFFLPPLWWVVSRMRLDQEFLADRRAANGYGPVPEYASSLLAIASSSDDGPLSDPTPRPQPVGRAEDQSGFGGSPLFQRFLMLLRCPFPVEPIPPVWWSLTFPWLAVVVILAVSTLTIRMPVSQGFEESGRDSFHMARLEIPATAPNPSGLCTPLEFPVALPRHFQLTVEVWGDLPALARLRLVGLPLKLPPASRPSPPGWHVVQLTRTPDSTRLLIDGHAVHLDPSNVRLTDWLAVEPAPRQPACFQSLNLTW